MLAHPERQRITTLILAWEDTKDVRSAGSQCLVVVNDAEQTVRPDLLSALRKYSITPIRWSERDAAVAALN